MKPLARCNKLGQLISFCLSRTSGTATQLGALTQAEATRFELPMETLAKCNRRLFLFGFRWIIGANGN